jgi:hypothetical protein
VLSLIPLLTTPQQGLRKITMFSMSRHLGLFSLHFTSSNNIIVHCNINYH